MSKLILMGSAALALALAAAAPALAQIRTDGSRYNQGGSSTFDSIDPTRTDPGSRRDYSAPRHNGRHSGSNGASSGERGTFDSGPNDPPPPYTPQREGGR